MSLNKEQRAARRANGSLLSVDRTPQSEDFFTDSVIDASKIPTPSPKKQPFHKAYKERRAIGNSRALKSAWQSGGRSSFSDSDGATPSAHLLRPTKLPSPGRSPSPLRQINRTSTPPPEISPTSPSILSSPAHGLDETYKRIAEEEDIAAQEGQLEDDEEYTDDMYQNYNYGNGQQTRPDDDSVPNTADVDHHAGSTDRGKENVPLEDGTGPTHVSDLSFLEELTDQDLAAKLTPGAVQAAKDRALLTRASQRQTPINFNGVKNGPTLAERLRRKDTPEADSLQHQQQQEPRSDDADDFREPPPNVPKSWAKPRPEKSWLSRSRQRRENGRNGVDTSPLPNSSQIDWAEAAADVPLPSVEDNNHGLGSLESSPATFNSPRSLGMARTWELNDFTGQSLQVSDSPPVRPRTNVVDQIQQREIERLEKQAVTTSRLGQYRLRQDPNILIRKLSRGTVENYPTPESSATPPPSGFHPSILKAITPKSFTQTSNTHQPTIESEAKPNSPIVIYTPSSSSSNGKPREESRPLGERKASEDRLARLARAMSSSPKSSSIPEDNPLLENENRVSEETPVGGSKEILTHDTLIEKVVKENQEAAYKVESSRQSSKEFAERETTPKAKQSTTTKTPKVTGAWTDTILPDTVLRTLRKQENSLQAQTPHVNAGGWIETPAPEGKRVSSALAPIPIEEDQEEEEAAAPIPEGLTNGITKTPSSPNPKSALTSLLARAKSRLSTAEGHNQPDPSNDTLRLNDSTINSLEDLLTLDNELTTLIRLGAESEAHDQLLRDQLNSEPVLESQMLERLSGKLQALRSNIHDARRGIGRLESQVARSPGTTMTTQNTTQDACRTCGAVGGKGHLVAISLPFSPPHLFHKRLPGQSLPRPTWLGWLTILAWGWYLLEVAMGEYFAHPLHMDEKYVWPREPEPRFPFVLPGVLWRGGGRAVWWVVVAVGRVLGQLLGWSDGFVDAPAVARVVEAGFNDLGGGGGALGMGMEGDVFL